ncbi:MAG: glycosyltransferase [Nocardioidaceae bacterium]|nr:glycosyltransferase [Nocardioidaceae bacterium]
MTPDVSVVVPVYNTMPYLRECLDSLVAQTIGLDRLEVVAVDDGSTDGSGELLDEYAARHPGTVVVAHQANSGGPASPCNAGLDLARGRYVFFLGADDHLGAEALERLVDAADRWESDVVFGTMEGVNGRYVHQAMFDRTRESVTFEQNPLAFAVSNTKLFRRSLVEEHDLRYREDMRVGSDQPFTVEAMVLARKISVLADYTYYYAVRRHDASNISYATTWLERATDIHVVMDHIASVVPEGALLDAILVRHFSWELSKLLKADFLDLAPDDQRRLCSIISVTCQDFLTPGVERRLWATARVRLRQAAALDVDGLAATIVFQRDHHAPLVQDGRDLFVWAPGFGDTVPRAWCAVTAEGSWDRLLRELPMDEPVVVDGHLVLGGSVALIDPAGAGASIIWRNLSRHEVLPLVRRHPRGEAPSDVVGPVELVAGAPGEPSRWSARVPLDELLASDQDEAMRWSPALRLDVGEHTYELAVRLPEVKGAAVATRGLATYRVVTRVDDRDVVYLRRRRLGLREGLGARRRTRAS